MEAITDPAVSIETIKSETVMEDEQKTTCVRKPEPQEPINTRKVSRPAWLISLPSGFIGSLFGALVAFATVGWQLSVSTKLEEAKLARDLVKDFATEQRYFNISAAIETCTPLYNHYGGQFNYREMNDYLDFFEDLGFYLREGILRLETIDHNFGAHTIEAYEDPHIKRYLHELRNTARQEHAYAEFESLAKQLEVLPGRRQWLPVVRAECRHQEKIATSHSDTPKPNK